MPFLGNYIHEHLFLFLSIMFFFLIISCMIFLYQSVNCINKEVFLLQAPSKYYDLCSLWSWSPLSQPSKTKQAFLTLTILLLEPTFYA